MEKANAGGVYFIFKSMEQGRTFRVTVPKYPTEDPNYRILAHSSPPIYNSLGVLLYSFRRASKAVNRGSGRKSSHTGSDFR